jgi:hypothetical protein
LVSPQDIRLTLRESMPRSQPRMPRRSSQTIARLVADQQVRELDGHNAAGVYSTIFRF